MRRGSRKMWWAVPCTSRKSLRLSESRMDIDELLKAKLATIKEEETEIFNDESNESNGTSLLTKKHDRYINAGSKNGKKNMYMLKVKMRQFCRAQFSFKDSYVMFLTGFASTRTLGGLSQY